MTNPNSTQVETETVETIDAQVPRIAGTVWRLGDAAWRAEIAEVREWLRGERPCECCVDGTTSTGRACGDCGGTGLRLVFSRYGNGYVGACELSSAALAVAAFVADLEQRGGLEHLPERSRRFVEELRSGLGAAFFEVIGRVQELDADLATLPDDSPFWVQGDPRLDR